MRFLVAVSVVACLMAAPALASSSTDTMKACAASWKSMSDADKAKTTYKAYSAACLKNHGPASAGATMMAPATPQARMKACAAKWDAMKKAGTTGGQNYKQFSATCLKKT